MPDLKLTLIQSALFWEDINANLGMFSEKIDALKEDTDVIILPEMFSTGFTMGAKQVAEGMDGLAVNWMKDKAKEKKCALAGSLSLREEGKYYNRLIWMNPDGTFQHYDKRHLFRLAHEQGTYTPGDKKLIIEYKDWKILPLVCYDLRFPVWSRRSKKEDYDLIIYVANWPAKRVQAWNQLLIARAIENQCYVAGVNRVGNDGHDVYHSGESVVINYKGEVINSVCLHESCFETVTINKEESDQFRQQLPFIEDADEFQITVR